MAYNDVNDGDILYEADWDSIHNHDHSGGALEGQSTLNPAKVTITQTATSGSGLSIARDLASGSTDSPVVSITQDNASDDQRALNIQQDGTGPAVVINRTNTGAENALKVTDSSISSDDNVAYFAAGGDSFRYTGYFYRDLTSSNTGWPVVQITQDNASDDQPCLTIQQDASAGAVIINQVGVLNNAAALRINVTSALSTNNNYPLWIDDDSAGSDSNLVILGANPNSAVGFNNYFYRNLTSTATASPVVKIVNDNASDDQNALIVQQDGTGAACSLQSNSGGVSLSIDSNGTSASISIDHDSTGRGIDLDCASGSAEALYITQAADQESIQIAHSGDADAVAITLQSGVSGNSHIKLFDNNGDNVAIEFPTQTPTSTPANGSIWFDGTNLKLRSGGTTYTIQKA